MKKTINRILMSLTATALVIIGATVGHAASQADGTTLYDANCAGCHGALASSDFLGATPLMILTGISSVPGMSKLGTLTADQILSISMALESSPVTTQTTPPPPKPSPGDGAVLYSANCASCHGALSSSSVARVSSGSIAKAIKSNRGGMRSINLTKAQLAYIAMALSGRNAGVSSGGKVDDIAVGDTYTSPQCAKCHYPDGRVRPGAGTMPVSGESSSGQSNSSGS